MGQNPSAPRRPSGDAPTGQTPNVNAQPQTRTNTKNPRARPGAFGRVAKPGQTGINNKISRSKTTARRPNETNAGATNDDAMSTHSVEEASIHPSEKGNSEDDSMADSDEDFGSHHSMDFSSEDQNDGASDSHSSGIGSDRSICADPEEENSQIEVDDDEMPDLFKVGYFLNTQDRARLGMHDAERADWHDDELKLFDNIDARGTKPFLPLQFRHDFPTCPDDMFTDNMEDTIINSKSGKQAQASVALERLVNAGSKIRTATTGPRGREQIIEREILTYERWAAKDGGYKHKRYTPVFLTVAGAPGQDIADINQVLTAKFGSLAEQHRENLLLDSGVDNDTGSVVPPQYSMDLPILYGIAICGSIVVLITYDSGKDDPEPRIICTFNFDDNHEDVWNGFGIAMMIIAARDYYCMRLDAYLDAEQDGDPDA